MKLTWYGHSCFRLEENGYSVVCDPFAPGSVPGLRDVCTRADAVLCSHEHRDHNYRQGVALCPSGAAAFSVRAVKSFHDECGGAKRGENLLHLVTLPSGLRVLHLGDLGHALSEETIAQLARPDLLLVPVGGHYTIDAAAAKAVCDALRPRWIIPMHYRGEGFGYDVIGPVGDFLRLFEESGITRLPGNVVTLPGACDGGVIVLEPPTEK